MAKIIATGFISDTINGIKVNSSVRCNADNFNTKANRTVSYIVMHYTGNKKDTALANCKYFQGADRYASAHFFVDNTNIYQSVALKDIAWHCGGSAYYHSYCRNANAIGIEMCCTAGNYTISKTTLENAAHLCAHLCKRVGITAEQVDTYVLRHYDVTHKKCPAQMANSANDADWISFKNQVKKILGGATASKPVITPNTTSKVTFPNVPFTVEVLVSDLNYRKTPSMSGVVKGQTGKGSFTISQVSNGWGLLKSGAGWIYLENPTYVKIGSTIKTVTVNNSTSKEATAVPFKVKVITDALNVREGAGTKYKVKTVIRNKGIYTIIETKNGWGKLKSGAGWISLDYTKRV